MIRYQRTIAALTVISLSTGFAAAQDCEHALIKDAVVLDLSEFHSLARAELLRRSMENDSDWAAGVTVPIKGIPVSANAESAESSREDYFSSSNLSWTSERVVSAATQNLSINSVEAYRACIDGQHSSGPRIFVHDATRTEATVTIKWFSPPGANTQADGAQVIISGGTFTQNFPGTWVTGGSYASIVKRIPDQDMRVIANIGEESDNVFVSLIPPAPPPQTAAITVAYCIGRGGMQGVHLWGPNGADCNGLPGWGKYDGARQETAQLGSCTGGGGFQGVALWGPVGAACGGMSNGAWGKYGATEVVKVVNSGLGSCVGRGDVLSGHLLWGPKGHPCGGIAGWGSYN